MNLDRRQGNGLPPAGTTLVELLIAMAVLLVVIVGLLGLFASMTGRTKWQGEVATRTTEYCQDKMEQLLALQFTDTSTNTTQIPWSPVAYSSGYSTWSSTTSYASGSNVNYTSGSATTSYVSNIASNVGNVPGSTSVSSGGTGLGGTGAGSTYGGTNPSSLVTGYYDYLDENGNMQGTPNYGSPFYLRMWQIVNDGTGTQTKMITVVTQTNVTTGFSFATLTGGAPSSTLVSVKANF